MIDGCKFTTVNNRTRNFTPKKLERALADIDAKIDTSLTELDQQDAEHVVTSELIMICGA